MKKFFACIFVIFSLFSVSAESLTGLLNIPLGSNQKVAFNRLMELNYYGLSTQNIGDNLALIFYSEDPYILLGKEITLITIFIKESCVENIALSTMVNNYDEFIDFIPKLLFLSSSLKLVIEDSSSNEIVFKDTLSENILRARFSERDGEYLMVLFLSKK